MSVPIHLALRNRARAAAGFPTAFATENTAFTPPTDGSYYAEEDFKESTRATTGASADSPIETRGLYVIRLHVPNNVGALVLHQLCANLIAQFSAAWAHVLPDGTLLRVRPGALPTASRVINVGAFALSVVTIYWRHETQTQVAA